MSKMADTSNHVNTQPFKDEDIDIAFTQLYCLLVFILSGNLKPKLDEAIFVFKTKLL